MTGFNYRCGICKKEFPMFSPDVGKIPQRESLKPTCNIIVHNFNVGILKKRCFRCDDKVIAKMEKILNRDRNRVDLSEKAFKKDPCDDSPFIEYAAWKKKKTQWEASHRYVCNKCNRGYDELKHTFSKNVRVLAGSYAVLQTDNTCQACIHEIIKELKEALR